METRYELLFEPFSTADAEYPQVMSVGGSLRVVFRDWQEKVVTLLFHDIVAFSWDDGDAAVDANLRNDCSYIVHNSAWVARHLEIGTLMPSENHKHYLLCFNAVGVLQVLATRLEVQPESFATLDINCIKRN